MPRASPRAIPGRAGPSLSLLSRRFLAVLRKIFARGAETAERRRITAVDRRMQQVLADLLLGDAVADGAVEVELEFLGLAERDQHRDVEHAADLARQPRARPHHAPGRLGGEHLHGHRERVGVLELPFYVLRAQHLLAQLQSLLEQLVSHCDAPPLYVIRAGCPRRGSPCSTSRSRILCMRRIPPASRRPARGPGRRASREAPRRRELARPLRAAARSPRPACAPARAARTTSRPRSRRRPTRRSSAARAGPASVWRS